MDAIYGEGLLRALALRSQDPLWLGFWSAVAFLGSASFFTLLLPFVFALARAPIALRLAARVMIAAWLSELLKWTIARPRMDPVLLGAAGPLEHSGSFENDAFPSGHVLMAIVIWVGCARELNSRRYQLLAWILVACIGFSRLALLRHDLLDVFAALLLGIAISWGLEWSRRRLRVWSELPWIELGALWLICGFVAQLLLPTPGAAIVSGVLSGAGFGAAQSRSWPRRRGTWRALLVLLNLLGVLLLRELATQVAGGERWLLFSMHALAGWWIAAATPWLTGRNWTSRDAA